MTRESSGSEQGKVTRRPITVLVAGDYPVLRAGVRCLLEAVDDFEVIAEAGVEEEVCLLCERYSPDVAVIDLTVQGIDGFRILEWVGSKAPRTGAVVLSGQDSPLMASLALDKGAAALLSRHSPSDGLMAAVRAVAANRKYLDSEVAQRLALARLDDRKTSVLAKLTRRELDVFLRLVQGRSPAVAAEQLGVSVKTVYGHRARIFQKLGAASLADLVLMAARHGVFAEKFEQETAGLANEANR